MIHLLSHTEADGRRLSPGAVHCITPYLNAAHFLSPPTRWLEALLEGEYSWSFFRFRYKSLLRGRFRQEPERFFALLDGSGGNKPLYLSCHCISEHRDSGHRTDHRRGGCHAEIALEFLEILRAQEPYRNWLTLRAATIAAIPGPAALAAIPGPAALPAAPLRPATLAAIPSRVAPASVPAVLTGRLQLVRG